ncbi:MAG TPA: hypothetical protein VK586_20120 [Streptosporangiaceae bacterium]|nr:hypothetical protein [Streptosporangiaceae bacterium]
MPPRPSAAQATAADSGRPASAAEAAAAQADPQAGATQGGGPTGTTPAGPQASATPPADPEASTAQDGPEAGTTPAGRPGSGARDGPEAGTTPAGPQASAAGGGPASERDPVAIGAFIERFAGILYGAGMARMPARVFAALLAADASQLSAADLAAVLGVSPAAVSGAVRYLGQIGLVQAAGEPGSRRLSYSVPDDVWEQLVETRNTLLARLNATLLDGVALLGAGTPAGDRLTRSARYFEFVLDEVALVHDRWREFGAPRGPIGSAEGDTGPDGTGRDGARADGPA